MKIIVSGANPTDEQKKRLESLGEVEYLPEASSSDDLIKQTTGADILYSNGAFLLESLPKFKDLFVTYPYVELGVFDSNKLKENGVTVANSQGGNRPSIVEWVMFMSLNLFRNFIPLVRVQENVDVEIKESLWGKNVLIVGHGSIGTKIAVPCEAFGMQVDFYDRGDDLIEKIAQADLVINALNCNTSSKNLISEDVFMNMKQGAYFVSFVRQYTYDLDGLLKAIDAGVVGGAAIDCDPEEFGDTQNEFYQKALSNDKVLVTPHIAWSSQQALANGGEIAVQNIEAWVAGKPQNILAKS
jgi:glycerate dehydrogenase